MELLMESKTVAELVSDNYRTADVFRKHGIDFCCGGKKTIGQVCREKHINEEELEKELTEVQMQPVDMEHDFKSWSPTFLVEYILQVHHKYVDRYLPIITSLSEKVARVHGKHYPETVEVYELWNQIAGELSMHMKKEELILFPYIRSLDKYDRREINQFPRSHFDTVKSPVRMMEQEHDEAGRILHRIQEITNNFTPPADACNTYRVLYAQLNDFQSDLHRHVHLENNILFPAVIELEKKLRTGI